MKWHHAVRIAMEVCKRHEMFSAQQQYWTDRIHSMSSHSNFLDIDFNIIVAPTPRLYKWYLSLKFPDQSPYALTSSPSRVTGSAYVLLLDWSHE
jgi:hypothetical protein